MKAKLTLAGASVLVVLGFAELVLRDFYAPAMDASTARVMRPSQDPELVYEMAPLAEAERDGVAIRINAAGFRDDPFPESRTPGELRVVVIGDSVAGGLGVVMEDAFPQLLEVLLRADPPQGTSAVVLNMSVYGYSTRQELRLLETRGLAADPDLVIVAYHLNDADVADAGQLRHFQKPPLALMELGRDAWELIRLWGDDRDYHTRIHEDGAEQIAADFRRLGAISQESGVPILVAVLPVFEWTPSGYAWLEIHQQLRALAESNGLGFLDLREALMAEPLNAATYDVWHTNARGHRIIAEVLARRVRRNPPRPASRHASR